MMEQNLRQQFDAVRDEKSSQRAGTQESKRTQERLEKMIMQ